MAAIKGALAAAGSTGNNTHASVSLADPGATAVAFNFIITAVGATPTVTWKIQGSYDDSGTSDANSSWFDMSFRDALSTSLTTLVANLTKTAVGAYVCLMPIDIPGPAKVRLVTSANTNVTYKAEVVGQVST